MTRLLPGFILIGVAFVWLFLFVGGPENKLEADIMTALTCQPGERFTQVLGGIVHDFNGRSGRSITFYCQDAAGIQRDVTGQGIVYGVAGFAVPLLAGLALLILGVRSAIRNSMKKAVRVSTGIGFAPGMPSATIQTDPFGQPINVTDFHTNITTQPVHSATIVTMDGKQANLSDLPPDTARMVEQVLGGLGNMINTANFTVEGGDLASRLQQLQEARDKNLITQEEYDRLRKEILDHME